MDLLITHTDLDGISNVILLKLCNIKFDYILKEVSELGEYLDSLDEKVLKKYDNIYITDLSMNKDIYDKLDKLNVKDKVKIFDHHKTHYINNNYNQIININECGTSIFYNYLKEIYDFNSNILLEYVNHVKNWDIWTWKENNDSIAPKLDKIVNLYGKEIFIKEFTKKLKKNNEFKFNNFEKKYLLLIEENINKYLLRKELEIIKIKYDKYTVGVLYVSKYQNELSEYLLTKKPELDFLMFINLDGGISFRTKKDEIDVSIIAKKINGGGHKMAAGAPINLDIKNNIIKNILGEVKFL